MEDLKKSWNESLLFVAKSSFLKAERSLRADVNKSDKNDYLIIMFFTV